MEVDLTTAILAAFGSWSAVKVELHLQRREINAIKKNQLKLARAVKWLWARKQTVS